MATDSRFWIGVLFGAGGLYAWNARKMRKA